MIIGVSGASGHVGQAVMAELQAKAGGHKIVGISRTPEKISKPAEGRLGDFDKPETLAKAYAGLDRVLFIPSSDLRPGVRARQFKAAIDAASRAGVKHLVLISSSATHKTSEPDMNACYWEAEQHLIKTASDWTILRMNYFSESFSMAAAGSSHSGVLAGLGENRVAFVSRDDLGAAAAGALLRADAGRIFNITGPTALTGAERATLISEVMKKPVRFVVADEAQIRAGIAQAGIPEMYADTMIHIEKTFVEGCFNIVTGDMAYLTGRPPRPLRAVLEAPQR